MKKRRKYNRQNPAGRPNYAKKKASETKNPVIFSMSVESEFERSLYNWLHDYTKELGLMNIHSLVIRLILKEQERAGRGEK